MSRVGVEETDGYGAGVTRHLTTAGVEVVEVSRSVSRCVPGHPSPSGHGPAGDDHAGGRSDHIEASGRRPDHHHGGNHHQALYAGGARWGRPATGGPSAVGLWGLGCMLEPLVLSAPSGAAAGWIRVRGRVRGVVVVGWWW